MDLRKLKYFVAVYEEGTFAAAAERIHVSQPAISIAIRHLEDRLGISLFDRGAFGARPTDDADLLYIRAKAILSDLSRLQHDFASLQKGEGGSVSVGLGPLFEYSIFPDELTAFLKDYPSVSISIVSGVTAELQTKLARGELDFVLSSPPAYVSPPAEVAIETLVEYHDVLTASQDHPCWDKPELDMQTLAKYPWVISARVDQVQDEFYAAFTSQAVSPPERVVRTDSVPTIRNLIAYNGHLAVTSSYFLEYLKTKDGLEVRGTVNPHFRNARQICFSVRRHATMSFAARTLHDRLRKAALSFQLPMQNP